MSTQDALWTAAGVAAAVALAAALADRRRMRRRDLDRPGVMPWALIPFVPGFLDALFKLPWQEARTES